MYESGSWKVFVSYIINYFTSIPCALIPNCQKKKLDFIIKTQHQREKFRILDSLMGNIHENFGWGH